MLETDDLPEKPSISTWTSFAAGTVGGLAGLAIGHPFDTVKVRLQSASLAKNYSGTMNCFTTIVRQEKIFGLYKGMASPAVGVALINALVFGTYTWLIEAQASLGLFQSASSFDPTLTQVFLAGTGSGFLTSFITCPMELAKIRLQNQVSATSPQAFSGPLQVFTRTFRAGGVRACYKGLTPTILRELSFGPYFVSYEIFCRFLARTKGGPQGRIEDLGGASLVVAGGGAGIVAWCSTYAADVLKTRIQSEPLEQIKGYRPYAGIWDCARRCYSEEGYRVFFRGLGATIVRAFPCNAATFLAYTWVMRTLGPVDMKEKMGIGGVEVVA